MKLMDLYNQIQNPIDDPEVIKKLISEHYWWGSQGSDDKFYYIRMIKIESDDNLTVEDIPVTRENQTNFCCSVFNHWKNRYANLEQIFGKDFYDNFKPGVKKLSEYLKSVADVSSEEEIDEFLKKSSGDEDSDKLIKFFKKNIKGLGNDDTFWHVSASKLNPKFLFEKNDIKHRLYINIHHSDMYNLVNYFYQKCDEKDLNYYFKFVCHRDQRDEMFVVYSSTDELTKYVEVLEEIKQEHPELASSIKNPTVCAGKINSWIGYGSEPEFSDEKSYSFNSLRAKVLNSVFEKAKLEWFQNNLNTTILEDGKPMTILNYIQERIEKDCFDKIKSDPTNYKYSEQDLNNPEILAQIKEYIDKQIMHLSKHEKMEDSPLYYIIQNSFLKYFHRELFGSKVFEIDPSFMTKIQNDIKNECVKYGIDKDKFCFDVDKVKLMEEHDRQNSEEKEVVPNEKDDISKLEETKGSAIDSDSNKVSVDDNNSSKAIASSEEKIKAVENAISSLKGITRDNSVDAAIKSLELLLNKLTETKDVEKEQKPESDIKIDENNITLSDVQYMYGLDLNDKNKIESGSLKNKIVLFADEWEKANGDDAFTEKGQEVYNFIQLQVSKDLVTSGNIDLNELEINAEIMGERYKKAVQTLFRDESSSNVVDEFFRSQVLNAKIKTEVPSFNSSSIQKPINK